jgi:predicted RNA-binding Zn ribbon-like protein
VQSFLDTSRPGSGEDELGDRDSAVRWLVRNRLIDPDTTIDSGDVARLVGVREALRGLARGNGGDGVDVRAVTALNEAARTIRLGMRLHPDDGYRLVSEGRGIHRPIGALLVRVLTAMADGTWERLKVCADDTCRSAYYDASRNRSGVWCSMATCGNRVKGRTYRQRVARRAAGPKAGSKAAR